MIGGKIGKKDVEVKLREKLNFPCSNLFPYINKCLRIKRSDGDTYPPERMLDLINAINGKQGFGYIMNEVEKDVEVWKNESRRKI